MTKLKVVSINKCTGGMSPTFNVEFSDGFYMSSKTYEDYIDVVYYKLMNEAINNYEHKAPIGATSHNDLYNY